MKKKRIGLRRKIISIICMLIAVMSVILMGISYKAFYDTYINFYYDKALGIVKMLANETDGDKIARYVETGSTDEAYNELLSKFNNVKANTSGLSYLYLMVPYENHFVYVIDAYTDQDDMDNISTFGTVFEYGETEYTYLLPDVKAKSASTQVVYGADAGYGRSISVWAPVFDGNGEVAAMVEGDYVLTSVENEINSYVLRILFFFVMALAVIAVIMLRVIDTGVVSPIIALTKYIDSYEKGNLTLEPVTFKDDNEIKWLSDSFGNMIDKIELYITDIRNITAEKERIGAELNVATKIQADMLPRIFPAFPDRKEFDIYASMNPAKEVGGDFYDFFMVDDRHLAVVVADVSGKGVPAALFMMISKTLIKNFALGGKSPAEVLELANNQLIENNDAGMFVTVWLGILDYKTGELQFANAGHNPPLLKKKNQEFAYMDSKTYKRSIMLGMRAGIKYKNNSLLLGRGDILYLYTDGVTEANNEDKELYGESRLRALLESCWNQSVENILKAVRSDIDDFAGSAEQFDDITMMVLKMKNASSTVSMDATYENTGKITEFAEKFLTKEDCAPKLVHQMIIALDEIYSNIVKYSRASDIELTCSVTEDMVYLTFSDNGIPYNPIEANEPDITLPMEERRIGGLGLHMVRKMMDYIDYKYEDDRNVFTVGKKDHSQD